MRLFNQLESLLWKHFSRFILDKNGASGIEYAIIATIAAVAIALFAGEGSIGDRISAVLTTVQDALPEVTSGT
ncbi:Flp family type IVb pilin [Vibrio olivae]|uniref:Flp family type IVb pilin n=1 Tax=Vibrio olivae TaxID=1243002 RepID=A0ABV5HM46_9VIBR